MKVSFTLDNPRRENSTIRASITFNGKRYTYPTGESVKTTLFKKQRCKASPEAAAINNKIEAVEAAIKSAILYFKQDFRTPTPDDFRKKVTQFLSGKNAIDIKRNDQLFLTYADEYIKSCGKTEETLKGYRTTFNKLREYEKVKGIRLTFDNITLKFAEEFRRWLIGLGYSRNYIGTHFKQIKKWMRDAELIDKLHNNQDYRLFKVEAETADAIYLNEEELWKLYELKIDERLAMSVCADTRPQNIAAKIRSLDLVKKKFLIGAYTALRVSDFNRIQDYNIQDGCITILPKKGAALHKRQPVRIPMHRVIKEILSEGFDLQAKISDQKINKHIKELCRCAGICSTVVIYRTEGGKIRERVMEKWEAVTTHTARRSGATNMRKSGIPKAAIMILTNHATEAQLDKYLKLSAEENAEALINHDYFKGWGTKEHINHVCRLIDEFREGI